VKVNTQNTKTERTLWDTYLNGDNSSLEEIHRLYQTTMLLVAYRYVRNQSLAQDIIQDIFERLLTTEQEDRVRLFSAFKDNPQAFLHVIVRNKCLDEMKISKNREKIIDLIRKRFNQVEYNNAYASFTKEYYTMLLDTLEPREREIIELHLSGFKNEEISQKLSISYNTVKNNIYESKKKLKQVWKIMTA